MLPYLRSRFYFHLSTHRCRNVVSRNTKLILRGFIVFTCLEKKSVGNFGKWNLARSYLTKIMNCKCKFQLETYAIYSVDFFSNVLRRAINKKCLNIASLRVSAYSCIVNHRICNLNFPRNRNLA